MKPAGECFDRHWRSQCNVFPISRGDADWMIRRHYLGRWPGVTVLILGMSYMEPVNIVGVIVFALPPRETAKRYGGVTWELARLWISDDVPPNAETYLIGAAVRHIRRTRPEVRFLVSYADPSVNHQGTIYRAANWIGDGRTDQERKTPRFDYADSVTGKRYSRRGHVPESTMIERIPRVSKMRFMYALTGRHRANEAEEKP